MSATVEVDVIDVEIPGGTRAAARPRFDSRSGRTHNPRWYNNELERVKWLLTADRKLRRPVNGDVIVELQFYRDDRRRVDVDNLVKTMLDAGTGILWRDDDQVVGLHVRKVRGAARARTVMRVRRVATDRAFL